MTLIEVLKKAAPCAKVANLEKYTPYLLELMPKYGINNPLRQRHFLAQILQESGEFSAVRENMNYSAKRLREVFPRYFQTIELAELYANKPEKIANRVYANRLGNGSELSNEGWIFRGGGLIQTTGKSNYEATGQGISVDLVNNPELITEPYNAVASACWFWKRHNINKYADKDDIVAVTKIINGGTNGLEGRKKYYAGLKNLLTI